ncbi:MAG TPA: NAD-dependent epimerase/dehydratase family protein [Acidimicrobiales bacterium]|nr:NAD-dependent epimerase/dehydratase family protein [Acidimicrobiales bacterium]
MSALKVLYVGGTGTISWSCVRRSVEVGHRVTVLNRGLTASRRPLPDSVQWLEADLTDVGEVGETLGAREFDATVNFLSFSAREVEQSIALFGARSSHYLHISTAAMYQKPPRRVPYLESTARHSPGSSYASEKIAAEDVLLAAYAEHGLPATIVRPSHTYDDRKPPLPGDWTVVERIARGEEIVVPGDGTSLWTVTHAEDFAVGLNGLLANPQTFGEAFHITSEFVYDWNQIYRIVAAALGTEARIVHVPSDFLGVGAPDWRWTELIEHDLKYSVVLDNSKIRAYVPSYAPKISFPEGARRFVAWRAGHPGEAVADPAVDAIFNRLVKGYHEAFELFRGLVP